VASTLGEAVIEVSAKVDSVQKEVQQGVEKPVEEAAKNVGSSSEEMGGKVHHAVAGAVAAFAGLEAVEKVKDWLGEAVKGAEEAQQQFSVMDKALANVGEGSQDAAKESQEYIESLEEASGVAKEKLIPEYTKLVSATGDAKESQKLLDEAMNISAGTHQNLKSVTQALIQAQSGQTSSLTRLGLATKDAHGKAIGFEQIQDQISKKFGGDWKANADTAAGQAARLKIAWEDMGEKVGTALLPVLSHLAGIMVDDVLPAVSSVFGFLAKNKEIVIPLVAALGSLVAIVGTIVGVTKAWEVVQETLNVTMDANPVVLIVGALIALAVGLVAAYKESETFRDIVNSAFGAVKGVVVGVADFITKDVPGAFSAAKNAVEGVINSIVKWLEKNWPLVVGILTGPIGLAVAEIVHHWDDIEGAIKAVVNWIQKTAVKGFEAALGDVEGAFTAIEDRVVGVWDSIEGGVKSVVGAVRALPGDIKGIGGDMAGAGRAIISQFIHGLSSAGGEIGGIAGSVWNAVKGEINSAIDKLNGYLDFGINKGPIHINVHAGVIPHLAGGTDAFGGGLAVVGEYGRELVQLPRGSAVVPAPSTAAAAYAAQRQPAGVVVSMNYYGPQTGGDQLRELNWLLTYGTGNREVPA
jgi:phage-related protein